MDLGMLPGYLFAFISLYAAVFVMLLFMKHHRALRKVRSISWEPVVSIVMPAHNEGAYIRECIESLLGVEYPKEKLDIIVVDDGSTDDTYTIAREFEGPNLRVFTKQNGGKASALNFGIAHAKGELIATMDADSYLSRDVIRNLIPDFDSPAVMAVTPAIKIRQSDSWLKEFQRIEYMMTAFSRRVMSFIDCVSVTPGPFSMFRAKVFEKVGMFDETTITEDVEMGLRIQSHNYRIRSSLTGTVYTEPPGNLRDLLNQRVRWQRGGLRALWQYRFMMSPKYGDFGMFVIPLGFLSFIAFLTMLSLSVTSVFFQPYYVQYLGFEAFALDAGSNSIWLIVLAALGISSFITLRNFKGEPVRLRHLAAFFFFYGYVSLGYNLIVLAKELTRQRSSW
jgi:cellulose synthase/poly-beta-1,6-N-acetylglucosamine synthase-like glycosyltransferase